MFAAGENDSEDLLINCASTRTRPAITSAWALVRESASPWSTSSLSMRSRFINDTLTQSERVSVARPWGKRLRYLDQPFPTVGLPTLSVARLAVLRRERR